MCTQLDAINIMKQAQSLCSSFFPVKDAYLYGSYARGDFHQESDIDILITTEAGAEDIPKYRPYVARITSKLSLENDITVSVTVKPDEQFQRFSKAMPFYKNVLSEGIRYNI